MVHFSGTVYPQVGRVATEAMNALYPNPDEVEEVFTVPLEYFLTQPRKHYTYHMTPDNLQELPEPLAEYVRHYKQTFVTPGHDRSSGGGVFEIFRGIKKDHLWEKVVFFYPNYVT